MPPNFLSSFLKRKEKKEKSLPCALWLNALNGWPCPGCGCNCCCWKASGGTWRKLLGPPPPTGESCPPTRLNCGLDEKVMGEGGGGGSGTCWFGFCLCWRKRLDSENGLLSPPNRLGKRKPPPPLLPWSWHWPPSNRMSRAVTANSSGSSAICARDTHTHTQSILYTYAHTHAMREL